MSALTSAYPGPAQHRVLGGSTSLVVHLPVEGLVLKIRTGPDARAAAQRDVALARVLSRYTSFAAPLEGAAALRDLSGATATVAPFLAPGPADFAGLGSAVRRLHAVDPQDVAEAGQHLERLDDLSGVLVELDGLRESSQVAPHRLDVLRRSGERLQRELDAIRGEPTVVHGDLHPPNIIFAEGGAVLCDTDEIGLADPRWDIAFLFDPGRPSRLAGQAARDFLDAYAGPDAGPDAGTAPGLTVARTFARAAHLRRTVRVLRAPGLRNRVWTLVRVGALQRMLTRPDLDLVPAVAQSRPQQVRSGLAAITPGR